MVRDKHLPAVVIYSGRQDLPSNARAFSLTSFETQSSSCDYIRVSGRFIYSIKCLQAFPSFLPLPALLLAPFFRTVFDSLLLNRTETLATQARSSWKLPTAEISSVLETSVVQVPLFTHRNPQKTEGILAYVKGAIVTIFAIFLESWNLSSQKTEFQKLMIQFCYLRLGIETVSYRLSQRMANEKVGPTVSSFNDTSTKMTKPFIVLSAPCMMKFVSYRLNNRLLEHFVHRWRY